MPHARGTFEVKTTPVSAGDPGVASARLSLAKTFAGDLVGTSRGDMWTADTEAQGSAGYVAIECVTATLEGRAGSFALQHSSTMRRGEPAQSIMVVPDSGTGGLAGLTGSMRVVIAPGGAHTYEFEYGWEAAP